MKPFKRFPAILCTVALASFIAGCGSDEAVDGTGAGTGSTFSLGTGTGTGFTDAALSIPIETIAPQATTTISVNVVGSNDLLYTGSATLTFSSTCALMNQATFSVTQVTTTTGSATVNYTDVSCTSDTITVSATDPAGNSHTATGTITISSTGGGSTTTGPIRIGNGISTSFVDGALSIGTASLSAGGSSAVVANIVDSNGALVTSSTTVTFSSTCSAAATATFSSNSVTTTNGTASVTYTAAGCTGTDTITARTTSQGTSISATGSVTVAAAAAGSIQFTSNSESIIALAGTGTTTGIPENAVVTFTVLDSNGLPLSGRTVNFTLNTTTGGIALASASAVSSASGQVQATVQSGTVATSVRVTAAVASTALTTQSTPIVVSTGFPDQGSMSLSAATLNPRGWNVDGTSVSITARVADRYNNRLQDGTAILFTTELGSIAGSCTTVNGACSVTWISQNPRGTGSNGGRTTIIATVLGEEDFVDVNSNGTFSDGDTFTDLGESFRDDNENGTYDSGELYTDLNFNGARDAADGVYNGLNCTHSTLCSTQQAITVRDSVVLIMAEDNALITSALPASINTRTTGSLTVRIVGYTNEQILPAGTDIDFVLNGAASGSISAGASHTVPNTSANAALDPTIADYTVYFSTSTATDTSTTANGTLTINVTFPTSGEVESFGPITITDQ